MFRPQRGEIGVRGRAARRAQPVLNARRYRRKPCRRSLLRPAPGPARSVFPGSPVGCHRHERRRLRVQTNPHKLQVTAIDERLQRVTTAADNFDCRQSHFAAIGQQHRPPVANDSASSRCKIPAFSSRTETVGYAMDKTVRNIANEKVFGKSVNPQ